MGGEGGKVLRVSPIISGILVADSIMGSSVACDSILSAIIFGVLLRRRLLFKQFNVSLVCM